MTRAKRRVSDFAVVLAVLILAALGTWQVQRLHWKEGIIAEREAKFAAPPIASWDDAAEFRRIRLEGNYLSGDPIGPIWPQNRFLWPFALTDGSVVFVESHWPPQGTINEGHLRTSEKPGPYTPANQPDKDQWFTADIPAAAAALKLERVRPWRVVPGPPPELANDHLQYAVTWYSLAVTLVVIYILARRRQIIT